MAKSRNLRRDTKRAYKSLQSKLLSVFTLKTNYKGNNLFYSFLYLFVVAFLVYTIYYFVQIRPRLYLT